MKKIPKLTKKEWETIRHLLLHCGRWDHCGFDPVKVLEFPVVEIKDHMTKWVRAGHVKTDKHWRENWVPNELF